jgi:anionic cell wall polymer biosynthesis LytR-Cps2A-Psr (LCP) family protein
MPGKLFPVKRVALTAVAFAVVAVAGIATVAIIPALAAGISGTTTTAAATPSPSASTAKHPGAKAVAAKRIALALFQTSVSETGLSRVTVLKDLLNGETLAQIDGSKAQAVESAVMAKITARLSKAETNGKITSAQEATLKTAATAGVSKLMNMNLSSYVRVRFGGFAKTPTTTPGSTPSPATATGASIPL